MLDDPSIDYTGGPVRPIWEAPCPDWIDRDRADLWGTLAILDYGTEAFVFEDRRRVPLGANMAVRRSLIDRIGGFDPELGRRGRSLLGQEQAEFFCRSRAVDARGMYEPAMEVHHHVPAIRLTRDYFYRWWYLEGDLQGGPGTAAPGHRARHRSQADPEICRRASIHDRLGSA